jgi:hypothetical protein
VLKITRSDDIIQFVRDDHNGSDLGQLQFAAAPGTEEWKWQTEPATPALYQQDTRVKK